MLGASPKRSSRRSAAHRRGGPGRRHPLARESLRTRGRQRAARGWSLNRSQQAVAAALIPAVGLVLARRRLRIPQPVTLLLASTAPLAVAGLTPRGRWRYLAVGAAYMWAFTITWTLPYDDPVKLRKRLRVDYPVRIDSLLGFGVAPTLRLQRALRDPPRVTAIDRAVTLAYASWFVPHILLAWLLLRHEEYVPRAAGRLAAAYHLTAPFYYVLPTAPPWWASEDQGRMDGQVERVRRHVLNSLAGRDRQTDDSLTGNPWASMPSDHIASAVITARGLAEVGPIYGAVGWTYVALASFSVVYLGEHYLIDVLVGLALAEVVHRGEATATPLVHRIAVQLDRLAS